MILKFNDQELKTLCGIYDLVVFLVHSGETFLHMLCDAMAILNLDNLFRSFILSGCEKDTKEATRLTAAILALICAILQELPENAKLIEKIIFHDSIDLFALLKHENSKIRLRACLMLRLLGRFCCFALQNCWSSDLSSLILEEMILDCDGEVKNEAINIIEEFKNFGWFRKC